MTPLERIALCILLDLLPSIDNFVYNAELIRSELLLTADAVVAVAALIIGPSALPDDVDDWVLEWDELYAVGGVAAAAAVADVNPYRLTSIAIIESVSETMKMATSYTRMDRFCTANVLVVMLNFPFEKPLYNFAFSLMMVRSF